MTTYESEGDVRRVLKAGAKGYLVKGADPGSYPKSCRRTYDPTPLPQMAAPLFE
jgi:DNA-binding NarL/FixJ family response regulator